MSDQEQTTQIVKVTTSPLGWMVCIESTDTTTADAVDDEDTIVA